MKTHKVTDEFKNTHYLKLLEIKDEKKKEFTNLFENNKLCNDNLDGIFILKDNVYKIAKIGDIDDTNDINKLYEYDILGKGGQGIVYNTRDADTVIKIALNKDKSITDRQEIKNYHKKVKKLIYIPLPLDISIAKPLSVLENEAGYVMHLLSGMAPYLKLLPSQISKEEALKTEIPYFLKELNDKDKTSAFYFAYYLVSGGLRKRLFSLSRLAIVLIRLHTRGLVYCDLSHNNIFLNNDEIPLIYLIDADNIEYENINKSVVYTPEYEVPEIVQGKTNSIYSDIYSFAILSYLTLTTTHPFKGEGTKSNDWDSEDSDKKEQWELPWIEDSNDNSNTSSSGLRGNLTITKELDILFHKVFEDGKNNKFKRPTLPLWAEKLERAATKTIKCNNCCMTYYDDIFEDCPYCKNNKPQRILVKSYYYKNNQKLNEKWYYTKEIDINNLKNIELPNYIFKSFNILEINDNFLEIIFSRKYIEFIFHKTNENIIFNSKVMSRTRKSSSISELENGITIIVEDSEDITTLIEIEIKK